MNTQYFHDLVKGRYGRKIAYANVEQITADNIVSVVGNCIGAFYFNKTIIRYLWNYYKGDQPVLYRTKVQNADITNKVSENHAYEIVQFKVGQTYGEPIQLISRKDDDRINNAVDEFNDYLTDANKQEKDIKAGEWQSATGTSFKAVQITKNGDIPFRIVAPTPMNTFVIYSRSTEEPLLAIQELKDADGQMYKLCYTDSYECKIVNGEVRDWQLHGFGGIPIVEFPNNHERISDIELVIGLLDAINTMQSNRMDGVEQFVQFLKREPNEAIPLTLDFDGVTTKNAQGKKIVKAGTPIGANGKADNTATVVGILRFDVTEDRPQGVLLKKAYLNTKVAEANSGVTYDAAVKTALPMIVFE